MLHRLHIFCSVILFMLSFSAAVAMAEPVDIAADSISRTADGVVIARGNVVIKRQWDTLMADEVKYRANQHVLEAKGHVVIKSDKTTIESDQAIMQTQSKTGYMEHAIITLPGGERLHAERVKRIDDQTYEAEEVLFSACPIDEESWRIAASHAVLDQASGSFTAKNARLELWQLPVLYTPWWQQSLRRKSGFLMPSVATGKRRGTEVSLPYYFAPQANWDLTLTPRWMSARGLMGELEARHVSEYGHEKINLAGINDSTAGTTRSRLAGELQWRLPANMQLSAKADHVSDRLYVADYATGNQISAVYLQSIATLSQSLQSQDFMGSWSLQGMHLQNLLLQSNASTLQILPRLQSSAQWNISPNLIAHLEQQSTRFSRRSGEDGWRVNIRPYIEMPWELAGGGMSATLTAGMQHTRYWLQQSTLFDKKPTRTTADASLEIRSDFERIGAGHGWRHVVSPIVRYDYISAPNQSNLPVFDSSLVLLNQSNLLSGNRFTGLDRIERSSRVSVLLENRLQLNDVANSSKRDVLIVRAGVSYDLMQTSIDAALQATSARPFSNLLGEVIWQPLANLRISSSGQYDPSGRFWADLNSSAVVSSAAGDHLSVTYKFTDARYTTKVQLLSLNSQIGLHKRWKATASWQYDMLLKLSQRTALGLQYNHPCWTAGLEAYRTNSPVGTGSASNFGFRLLLEFKGLGSVGS